MTRRRSSLEIMAGILEIAREGAGKTQIVYGANLNFQLLHDYLRDLERAGLIAEEAPGGTLRTTERGLRYLSYYDELMKYAAAKDSADDQTAKEATEPLNHSGTPWTLRGGDVHKRLGGDSLE